MKKRMSKPTQPKPDKTPPGMALGRILNYGRKVYALPSLMRLVQDSRKQARISTRTVVIS